MKILLLLELVLLVLLFWLLLTICGLLMLFLQLNLIISLLRAWDGELHANSAFLMWSFSCCNVSWFEQTTLSLHVSVLKCCFWLWLSDCCQTGGTGPYVLASCTPWLLKCCWDLGKADYPGKVRCHLHWGLCAELNVWVLWIDMLEKLVTLFLLVG